MRPQLLLPLLAIAVACGGDAPASDVPASGTARPLAQASGPNLDPAAITPAMVALGDSIFHGKVGASSCQACHGIGGKDGAAAPNLTDSEWLHSDGSLEGIFKTIKSGVMSPKQFTSVMPPYGGVMLPEDRTLAVAAYVYRLSHP
ncbi:MAG: c-type cytochrome [Gemmatimonadaceae bacterium]|nr:c-type cytochrome [Gemmatimonadaceae bacterium]